MTTEATATEAAAPVISDNSGQNVPHEMSNDTPQDSSREVEGASADSAEVAEQIADLSADEIATLEKLLPRYKHNLKVNGEERPLSFSEMVEEAQKASSAQQKFKEANAIERRAQEQILEANEKEARLNRFMKLLTEDPGRLQEESGLDPKEFREATEKYLYEQLQRDQMSDEDRAIYEKARQYDLQQEELAKYRDRESANAQAQMMQQYRTELDQKMTKALSAHAVPDSSKPYVVKQVAAHLHALIGQGVDSPDVDKVTELVVERMNEGVNSYVTGLPIEELEKRLTKDQLSALRKAQLEAVKTPQDKLNRAEYAGGSTQKQKSKSGFTRQDWAAHKKKLLEGLA